tara:strand:+ start:90 stop:275 length:186 start_codon:yes stop_codon:yes gene_type:complete
MEGRIMRILMLLFIGFLTMNLSLAQNLGKFDTDFYSSNLHHIDSMICAEEEKAEEEEPECD